MASRQSALGFWAMCVTLWTWWKLLRASVQDAHATEPPPHFVTVMVKSQQWSIGRVANFYEGLLTDAKRDTETYAARAREVESQVAKARAESYAEGVRDGVRAERDRVVELCKESDPATLAFSRESLADIERLVYADNPTIKLIKLINGG